MNNSYEEQEPELPEPFDADEAIEQAFDRTISNEIIARADVVVREMQLGGALIDYAAKLRANAVDALHVLGTLDFYDPEALGIAQQQQNTIADYWRVCAHVSQVIESGDAEQEAIINDQAL